MEFLNFERGVKQLNRSIKMTKVEKKDYQTASTKLTAAIEGLSEAIGEALESLGTGSGMNTSGRMRLLRYRKSLTTLKRQMDDLAKVRVGGQRADAKPKRAKRLEGNA